MSRTISLSEPAPLQRLEDVLSRFCDLLVAFSGGVDSGVLLAVSRRVLGDRVIALTTDSASMPRRELRDAIDFARGLKVRHLIAKSGELRRDDYVRNDRDRCYVCKQTLFELCAKVARSEGVSAVAYGYTCDDAGDYRPGHRAAIEFNVRAPLYDAGLGKSEIRAMARELGLGLADKPAAPCLSSRIPYRSDVTEEKLNRIERMEELLRELGFRVCRARYDGNLMRIEVPEADIPRTTSTEVRARILQRARELGIRVLTIDLEGFRSGKLNEV